MDMKSRGSARWPLYVGLLLVLAVLAVLLFYQRTIRVTVETDPTGGAVFLDGSYRGNAPTEIDLRGKHRLKIAPPGSAPQSATTTSRPLTTVRTAYLPITAYLPLFVAMERKYFEQNGVRVEATEANNPNDILTGIASGQVDFATSLAYTILFPGALRYPDSFRLYSSSEESRARYTSSIVVPKGSTLRTPEDLRGKKIGVYQGIVQVVFLKAMLEGMGISADEVTIVEISPRLQIQGLVSGQYDALSSTEPTVNVAVLQGTADVLVANPRTRFIMSPFPSTATAISTHLIKRDPEAAQGVARALDMAVEFIQKNPEAAKQYLLKYTPIPKAISPQVLADLKLFEYKKLGEENRLNVQRFADYLYKTKLIPKPIPDVNVLFGNYEPLEVPKRGGPGG